MIQWLKRLFRQPKGSRGHYQEVVLPPGIRTLTITWWGAGGGGRCGLPEVVAPHEGKAADIPPIDKSQDPTP